VQVEAFVPSIFGPPLLGLERKLDYGAATNQVSRLSYEVTVGAPGEVERRQQDYRYGPDGRLDLEEVIDWSCCADGEWEEAPPVTFAYDGFGRLESAGKLGSVTGYGFDRHDNLGAVVDANGQTTTMAWGDQGVPLGYASPDQGTGEYVRWDEASNLLEARDGRGKRVGWEYDNLGRLRWVRCLDAEPGEAGDVEYRYDEASGVPGLDHGKGRLTSVHVAGADVHVAYRYDGRGNLREEERSGSGAGAGTTAYGYDRNDRLTSITYPLSGREVRLTWDAAGRVRDVEAQVREGWLDVASSVGYLPFGPSYWRPLGPGHHVEERQQDRRLALTRQTFGALFLRIDREYRYQADESTGYLSEVRDLLDPAKDTTYHHDAQGRLYKASGPWGTLDWEYDGNGNRLQEKRGAGPGNLHLYTYDPVKKNRLLEVRKESGELVSFFEHDGAGTWCGTRWLATATTTRVGFGWWVRAPGPSRSRGRAASTATTARGT
jgi:YD repeat-containing protein